jgi:cyanophycinase
VVYNTIRAINSPAALKEVRMPRRYLFLLGGNRALGVAAERFVPAAGGRNATIALLLQGGPGTERHLPGYTRPWATRGAARYSLIVPLEDATLDLEKASAHLKAATGIFIGGGHTPTYHRLYASEPVRSMIRERYEQGIPVAGLSAGALIAPEVCTVTPDSGDEMGVSIMAGLGLVRDIVIGVHFGERNALPGLLEAMVRTQTPVGWGIDEAACAVFEDGRFTRALGRGVHRVVLADWQTRAYTIEEQPQPDSGS